MHLNERIDYDMPASISASEAVLRARSAFRAFCPIVRVLCSRNRDGPGAASSSESGPVSRTFLERCGAMRGVVRRRDFMPDGLI